MLGNIEPNSFGSVKSFSSILKYQIVQETEIKRNGHRCFDRNYKWQTVSFTNENNILLQRKQSHQDPFLGLDSVSRRDLQEVSDSKQGLDKKIKRKFMTSNKIYQDHPRPDQIFKSHLVSALEGLLLSRFRPIFGVSPKKCSSLLHRRFFQKMLSQIDVE